MSKLSNRISELVAGCFSAIWIESHEPQEAMLELGLLCRDQEWHFATWNIDQGMRVGGSETPVDEVNDPLAAVKAAQALGGADTSILVLENFHRFLKSAEIIQAMVSQIHAGKQSRSILIVLAPTVELEPELEKQFVIVEHEMPDREQLKEIAQGIGTGEGELPEGHQLEQVLDASGGLTRGEAESAFSLSLVRHGRIQPDAIWELKSQMLKKSGLLEMYRGDASFETLGGMTAVKDFCKLALGNSNAKVKPRGIMLLSPPGCGKTQLCKALGHEVGRPVIMLDVGSLMGSLVGQTEQRTRLALKTIDAMQPAVVLLDEVEKSLAGVSGSSSGDSGVSSRMFGTFLSWLNDRESDTFVVCTANDVSRLPPEFARAERFDAVYFLDLPTRADKDAIWDIYLRLYSIEEQRRPNDKDWTGAEIKACCRLSVLLEQSLVDAARNVVPVAATAAESIDKLRQWASGRCLDADRGGIFASRKKSRRRSVQAVGPRPSDN